MKYLYNFIAMVLILSTILNAKPVDENTAKLVANNFILTKMNSHNFQSIKSNFINQNKQIQLDMAYKATALNNKLNNYNSNAYYYIFSINPSGYIIVSGDDEIKPILAYSEEPNFNAKSIPINTQKWLDGYKKQIKYAIENNIVATNAIKQQWIDYKEGNTQKLNLENKAVMPIIQTKWNQSPFYNELCPDGSVTGCVATAMAQVMKHWNYPEKGVFSHSYDHPVYGNLSANFGKTTYLWDSMPNSLNQPNISVATLMYHCGISVNMGYSPSGSGASMSYVGPALMTYFSYKNTMHDESRSNYTDSEWIDLLKSDLDSARPILYAGYGSVGGHAFVCDGYDNENYFHFNWGWGGACDGYFAMDALLGEAGNGFNAGQMAIINVQAPVINDSLKYKMVLSEKITPFDSLVEYNKIFYIQTNIKNESLIDFVGDYAAMIFDSQSRLIDSIEVLKGQFLQAGTTNPYFLTFSSKALKALVPGTYNISIYYRPKGLNWNEVLSTETLINNIKITVFNPTDFIELKSPIEVTNGTILTQKKPATVKLNIINNGTTRFYGQYQLALYGLDGQFAQMIKQIDEKNGLAAGASYQSNYLDFTCKSIVVEPGTYYLTLQHKSNDSDWKLTSSPDFENPIKVIVRVPEIYPDKYESNDSIQIASPLYPSFSGNLSKLSTDNANLHLGNDIDFYRVILPLGSKYTIYPQIFDSFNNDNDNTYTGDGLFSYSFNGQDWSEPSDDSLSYKIEVDGGGDIYFSVVPYSPSEIGTYLLDFEIRNIGPSGISEPLSVLPIIYPNPSNDFIKVSSDGTENIVICNILGEVVLTMGRGRDMTVDVSALVKGIYFVKAGGITTKFVKM